MDMNEVKDIAERITGLSRSMNRPFRALIIDDEPWVGSVLAEFCSFCDVIEPQLCYNGVEALEKLAVEDYDFATVDLVMPELSGVETVQRIRELRPGFPLMIVTGNATERMKVAAGCAGARTILEKPVDAVDFLREVAEILERQLAESAV